MSRSTSVERKSREAGIENGERKTICMNWRMLSGRLVTCSFLITVPVIVDSVSSSGVRHSTVTISCTSPSSSLKSTRAVCCTSSFSPRLSWVLKPVASPP